MKEQDYKQLRARLRREIGEELSRRSVPPGDLRRALSEAVHFRLMGRGTDLSSRLRLIEDLFFSMQGLDILQPLMDDEGITEIMVNGPERIFIERRGRVERTALAFDDRRHLTDMIVNLFSRSNKNLNLTDPIADLRLDDGSRANAVLPPLAPDGPLLTIRKFCGIRPSAEELLASGFMGAEDLERLRRAVLEKKSLFICGGTGSGKTTLLNVLSNFIPEEERVITIEDSAELQLQGLPNLVRLESRAAGPELAPVDIAQLIRCSLRMRPDRIIVGEVRGAEAFDLLTAMNSGHPGTLCTGHANSCADMLRRLCNMILAATSLPYEAIMENLIASIDYLIHVRRGADGRRELDEFVRVEQGAHGRCRLVPVSAADAAAPTPAAERAGRASGGEEAGR